MKSDTDNSPPVLDPALAPPHADFRSGIVAVVGRANVGKSSLVNHLLREKVSIVSPVAQTTRNLVRGVLTEERGQVVFLDTPGVHKAVRDLGRLMNKVARASTEGVDVILLVMDGGEPPRMEDEGWMRRIARDPCATVFALNKDDLDAKRHDDYRALWQKVAGETQSSQQPEWVVTSAATGKGGAELLDALMAGLPLGPLLFPRDVLTDFPRKLIIADVVREKYLTRLTDELPHCLAVWIDEVNEDDDAWLAHGKIYVQRPSQKGIVIGKKGRLLKRVLREATHELSEMYERDVRLDLVVTVEKNWDRNFWILKRLGYA